MSDVTEEQVTKPKKVMTEDQLAKLAVARSKALQVRRQQHAEKLKQRAEAAAASVKPSPELPPVESPLPPSPPPPKKKKAPKPPADPVVVVEQSSDDSDTFDAPPGVIFVKRRRSKKAVPPPPMTEEEAEMDYAYRRMVNGDFHMGRRR
jgi:hypothetical protein